LQISDQAYPDCKYLLASAEPLVKYSFMAIMPIAVGFSATPSTYWMAADSSDSDCDSSAQTAGYCYTFTF